MSCVFSFKLEANQYSALNMTVFERKTYFEIIVLLIVIINVAD